MTETSTKAQTEKHALEKRLTDIEAAANKREADLKADLDANREKVDALQVNFHINWTIFCKMKCPNPTG